VATLANGATLLRMHGYVLPGDRLPIYFTAYRELFDVDITHD
jgi:hypothetical protein